MKGWKNFVLTIANNFDLFLVAPFLPRNEGPSLKYWIISWFSIFLKRTKSSCHHHGWQIFELGTLEPMLFGNLICKVKSRGSWISYSDSDWSLYPFIGICTKIEPWNESFSKFKTKTMKTHSSTQGCDF